MEIERKFLVNREAWDKIQLPSAIEIRQGYLSRNVDCTVRVRTKNNQGFITVKGKNQGISREEFEYEIPHQEAVEMLNLFAEKQLIKDRFEIEFANKIWEIDVFKGKLAPLIIAEIELESEDDVIDLPPWVGMDVSHDERYYNSNLVENA